MWQGLWRMASRQRLPNIFWCPRRCISTTFLDPSLHAFTSSLVRQQPVFELPSSSIQILAEPSQFYKTLLDMIKRAERRIFISSLYIDSSESELISTLENRLREKPYLKLYLLLDLNRSTRPGPSSATRILLPLLRDFPSRVHISMFRSPNLRGFLAKIVPPRFKEGWGTWHAKIYGVDDDVMISGANLSTSYFTNRQDRYLYFSAEKKLAQYCFDFINTVAKFSYQLLPNSPSDFLRVSSPHSYSREDYTLSWPDSDTHPHHIHKKAEKAFLQLQKLYRQPLPRDNYSIPPAGNTFIIPIIQAGQFNIREEESIFQLLFHHIGKLTTQRPMMNLTSGYFSLYKPYQDLILQAPNLDCRIVAASPKANGFYGSCGISGRIPEGYTLYEHRFMRVVVKAGRLWKGSSEKGDGVLLSEWEKPGWTYHAKGVWLSPNSSSLPVLTLFGSTNLNSRSAHIDTELSFLMVIPSESAVSESIQGENYAASLALRQKLDSEISGIRSNTVEWQGGGRKVRWTTKLFVWLVKGML